MDEKAIPACAAYVDPIRAAIAQTDAIAQTIEQSDFTSAQQRALELVGRSFLSLLMLSRKTLFPWCLDELRNEFEHAALGVKWCLPSVGIDPLFGEEVLFWAELKGVDVHSTFTLRSIIADLELNGKVEAGEFSKIKVTKILKRWGEKVSEFKPKGSQEIEE